MLARTKEKYQSCNIMKLRKLTLALCAALLACTQMPQMKEVTFHTNLIESGALTKASDHDEIISLIESTYPTISPKLYYSDDEYVTIPLNTPVNVRVGYWLIKWASPSITHMAEAMNYSYFALQPYMQITQWTDITATQNEYELPVKFYSSAFLYDSREVSKVSYNATGQNLPSTKIGFYTASANYACFFLNWDKDEEDGILMLQVTPVDGKGKVVTHYFSYTQTTYNGEAVHKLEHGHYYVLHPGEVTDIDASFLLSFPDWQCDLD